MSKSETIFEEAVRFIPGGVNSPVRAFGSIGSTPRMIARASGANMWDEDGNEYRTLIDTVYRTEGHTMKGTEPVGTYEQHGAAIPLTEAEAALAELEAVYDAG